MPGMGRTEDFDNPRLTGMRRWRVRGFDHYLIFYQPLSQGLDFVHGRPHGRFYRVLPSVDRPLGRERIRS